MAKNPNNILLLLQAPSSGPHEVRNCLEAAVPEKEAKILRKGRAATGAHLINTRPFKRAIVRFSGMRSCGDIHVLNFLINFFEKRPGQLGLKRLCFLSPHRAPN